MKKLIQVLSIAAFFAITFNAKGQGITYTYTGGDLNNVTSWSPTPPSIPSGNVDTWYIAIDANVPFSFGDLPGDGSVGTDDWIVTSGSSIIIGDGTNPVSIIIDGHIYSDAFSPDLTLYVANNANIYDLTDDTWDFTFNPAHTTFATGSTIYYDYDASNYGVGFATISPGDYSNVSILQDAKTSISATTFTVENNLDISATLTLANSTCILKGNVTGSGSFTGSTGSGLDIESTGSVGTLIFTPANQVLKNFKIGSGSAILGTDLLISSGSISTSTVTSSFDQSGGSLKLNGHTLTLDVDNIATFGSSSHVLIGGGNSTLIIKSKSYVSPNLYMDQTSTTTSSLKCLILNGSSSGHLYIANKVNITDSVTLTSGFITINTAGDLTLLADQTTVGKGGRLGIVGGTFLAGSKITSQVYHKPPTNQTNWMLMGSAGLKAATFTDWNANFAITCPTCPYTGVGGNTFNSVQSYDETSGTTFDDTLHYNPIGGLTDPITPGQGYWVYLGTANPGINIPGELISVVGEPKTSNVNVNITNSNTADLTNYGFNLVANPYPSPISWTKVMRSSGLYTSGKYENSVYAYSANYNGGDYVAYNALSGISNPATGTYTIGDNLPIGLGFYVQTGTNNSTLAFTEKCKISDPTHQFLFRESSDQSVNSTQQVSSVNISQTHYFSLQALGNGNESWAAIAFNGNATDTTDGYDAMAMGYNGLLQISSTGIPINGKDYGINCMPELNQNYTIPVKILSGTTAQYQINPIGLENMLLGACLNLHDNYLNANYDLRGGSFNLTINDTETVARFTLQVTMAQLPVTVNATQATCANTTDGLITAVGNNAGPWNYIWRDANGTIIKTSLNKPTADSLTSLNNGVFTVEINTVGACDGAVQTFTFTSPVVASVFTAPTQVTIGSAITFTNTSANATSYNWQFGDGSTASQQNPSYTYNNTGTYTVALYAINTACNDTATSTQVVEVDANTVGIKSLSANNNSIYVSKDATGNYLQFNYATQTKVNITVYNVLGQVMLSNAGLSVVTDKIYLNLNDNKNQVLYVTVTDLTTNTQTTKKFVNN